MKDIAFIGDLTVDTYPELGKTHLGGASLNSAMWARRAGADKVSVVAAVGSDEYGKQFIRKMTDERINTDGICIAHGETSNIEIYITQDGDRRWGTWEPGVLANYHLRARDYISLQDHKAAALTVYSKTQHLLFDIVHQRKYIADKSLLVVNFGDLSHFGRSTNIIEANIHDIDICIFGFQKKKDYHLMEMLQKIAEKTGKLMIATLAEQGVIAWKGSVEYFSPALHTISLIDATGAGDAFLAGFLVKYLKDHDIQNSLVMGNKIAAQKILVLGSY